MVGKTRHPELLNQVTTEAGFPGAALLPWLEPIMPVEAWTPRKYRPYAPLVRDGLAFFLAHLPHARLQAIVREQLGLEAAAPARRLSVLMRRSPVLHKLAQVLAHDQRLEPGLRRRLAWLETLPPTMDATGAERLVRQELGEDCGMCVERPLAEASVAVVIPYARVADDAARKGVLKVLKPGIEQRLGEDLEHWSALGAFLEERAEHYGLAALPYQATFDSVASLLRAELRLDREQAHLARAAQLYAQSCTVKIPALFPECSSRVTAMERIYGRSLADIAPGSAPARRLARRLLAGLFVEPLSGAPLLFHGDPHPGNLLLTEDGRIAVFDWALAVELDEGMRRRLARLVLAGLNLDGAAVAQIVADLGRGTPDRCALGRLVDEALGALRWGRPLDAGWVLALLDSAVATAGARFPDSLIVLRKSLQMGFGVFADLAPDAQPGVALTQAAVSSLSGALGRGRLPATGLKADDWRAAWVSASLLPGRYWLGLLSDIERWIRDARMPDV